MLRSIAFISFAALALAGCDSGAGDAAQETAASTGQSGPATPPQLPGRPVRAFAGTPLPALVLDDPAGNTLDLAALEGPVLVNLWATWCAPCVVEMPMLDNLAGAMEGELRVLTISQDVRGAEVVAPFFAQRDFRHLEQWLDPDGELSATFTDGGLLPITILFDAQGHEIMRVAGGYEWDSEAAIAELRSALAQAIGKPAQTSTPAAAS
ncbi:TlpA family protein disulfide reductase [Qipengyuania sp. ASV99]|uniref:TlpA family protein disulfide reductase n=1 Tax=Qipengyuania sp. ASV99 TaxID=3399681 RepID=UPI003A4C5303